MPSGKDDVERGEEAAVAERAAGGNVERGEPVGEGLGDDQRAAVGGDHHAVREDELVADARRAAVGIDADDACVPRRRVVVPVVAEIADVGPARGVHHHVIAQAGRESREIGMEMQRLAVEPQHAPVQHRDDEQLPLQGPAEAGGALRDLDDRLGVPGEIDGRDAMGVEVGEPELAVAPPRRLGKLQSVEQDLDLARLVHATPLSLEPRPRTCGVYTPRGESVNRVRLSPLATARTILVPAALPEIVTGLRVGFSLALIGTLLGEMFGAQHGLGHLLMQAMSRHNIERIMALTLLIVLFAAAVNAALLALDRRLHARAN